MSNFSSMLRILITHYSDVTMGAIASQITSLTTVYSTVYSEQVKEIHQSSASLAFVWGIQREPANSRKMFPFDDVIMGHKAGCKADWGIETRRPKMWMPLMLSLTALHAIYIWGNTTSILKNIYIYHLISEYCKNYFLCDVCDWSVCDVCDWKLLFMWCMWLK